MNNDISMRSITSDSSPNDIYIAIITAASLDLKQYSKLVEPPITIPQDFDESGFNDDFRIYLAQRLIIHFYSIEAWQNLAQKKIKSLKEQSPQKIFADLKELGEGQFSDEFLQKVANILTEETFVERIIRTLEHPAE